MCATAFPAGFSFFHCRPAISHRRKRGNPVNYAVDIVTVLVLAAFAGRGAARGLILTVGKLVTLVGGFFGAHLGAFYLKGMVAARFILPWIGERMEHSPDSGVNPVAEVTSALGQAGAEVEQQVVEVLKSMGIPEFSFSRGWGTLIDRMTGTGTNIMETASRLVAERIAYVLVFILLFLVIQLSMMILFTSIDGLKNLPVAGLVNKLGGAAAGLVIGGLALWGLMAALTLFVPSATDRGGFLSPDVLGHTVVAKKVYHMVETFLQSGF